MKEHTSVMHELNIKQNLEINSPNITSQNMLDNKNLNFLLKNNSLEKDYCDYGLNSNVALRNRLAKQSSASPHLIKKSNFLTPYNASFQQSNTPFQTRRLLTNTTLSPATLSQKRSSLLFFPNIQSDETNKELLLTKYNNNNKINFLDSNLFEHKKQINFNQIEDKTKNQLAEKFVICNNKKFFDKDLNKKLNISNEKNKELTQIDLSSTESLPLDVSRYDNVVPQKNQGNLFLIIFIYLLLF